MASDSEAGGPQTDIVAKTQFDLSAVLPLGMPYVFFVVGAFVMWGIRDLLILIIVCPIAFLIDRYLKPCRARFDNEGMTLLWRGVGRLRARPFHFRWDEVLEIRRPSFWYEWAVKTRLNRPRKFWTFRRQPKNSIKVPKSMWTRPQFVEAIRLHVPAERITADLAGDGGHPSPARSRFIGTVIFLCAAAAAGCSLALIHDGSFMQIFLVATSALLIGALAMSFYVFPGAAALGLVAGFLNTLPFLVLIDFAAVLFIPGGQKLLAAGLGAAAGALLGAAIMVIKGNGPHAWRFAGATLLLTALGFSCGWAGFRQVAGTRAGFGGLSYESPWTPQGDAFLLVDEPRTVCWYSSDLKLERRDVLPDSASLVALGQEAALFRVHSLQGAQLWFVPRHAEPRVIDEAPFFLEGKLSPDSRHALIPIRIQVGDGAVTVWEICDLTTGQIEPVNFPGPPEKIRILSLRNDQTLLWLTGSAPLDKKGYEVNRFVTLPEGGEFAQPGKPYVVRSWKINSAESPRQVYAAKTQWLQWTISNTPEQLHVCRLSENPPLRREFVALDFAQSPPVEAAISEGEFDLPWGPKNRSFDGRFTVAANRSNSFSPAFIMDTKTGRNFRMQSGPRLFSVWWSPISHKFLMEVPEMKLAGGLWRWHHWPEDIFERVEAVYLVDMDRP